MVYVGIRMIKLDMFILQDFKYFIPSKCGNIALTTNMGVSPHLKELNLVAVKIAIVKGFMTKVAIAQAPTTSVP